MHAWRIMDIRHFYGKFIYGEGPVCLVAHIMIIFKEMGDGNIE
jgi:hypothetical protein